MIMDMNDKKNTEGQLDKPRFVGESRRVKLGDICEIVSGATPKTKVDEYWGGSIKWITPAELNDSSHIVCDTARHLTEAGYASAGLRLFPKGTVILSTRAPIGKVAIAGDEMCCNQGFKNLICSKEINNEYLYHYLRSHTSELQSLGRGATFKELSKKAVAAYEITLPSLDRQLEAVERFSFVENQIAAAKTQIEKFDQLVKSRFVEVFGTADRPPAEFPVSTIGEVCDSVIRGPFGSALKKSFFVPKGDDTYKVYEQKHAIQRRSDIGTYYITSNKYEELKRFECFPGDILMSCSGTMGKLYQLPQDCERGVMNQALCKFKLGNSILPDYFFGFMEQVVDDLGAKGSGIKNVSSVKFIKAIKIPLPPIEVQLDFAAFVSQVDKPRFAIQQQIEKLEMLKASLMQEYFG